MTRDWDQPSPSFYQYLKQQKESPQLQRLNPHEHDDPGLDATKKGVGGMVTIFDACSQKLDVTEGSLRNVDKGYLSMRR